MAGDRIPSGELPRELNLGSATALVIATVIGVGIFTSTGFQAEALPHPGYILLLWVTGGILALCGALCYAELGAAWPEAGAEYAYLRESCGYTVAFMSAVVSLVAGFSAPIAAVLKSFTEYLAHFVPILGGNLSLAGIVSINDLIAACLVWILIGIHLRGTGVGFKFNNLATAAKVLGIIVLLIAAAFFGQGRVEHLTEVSPAFDQMSWADRSGAFASSLIFVMFCYAGYNAAAYVASEINEPQRVLPKALLLGTGLVIVLYLGLNIVYLYGAGVEELAGKVDVGVVAAEHLFGPVGVSIVTGVLLVGLLSAASAMTIAGPRVYYAMGRDFPAFRKLTELSPRRRVPAAALILQGVVASLIIFTGAVDEIEQYVGFILTIFASLAVASVFILRARYPDRHRPFRTWGYPFTPILFLLVSGWMLIWNFRDRPWESLAATGTVAVAGVLGRFARPADDLRQSRQKNTK
jgi:APA family basic amino acid/polyamine antiporter